MKMLITYLGGFICGMGTFLVICGHDPIPTIIVMLLITFFSFFFCHKIHKKKQKEYYDRFKMR